MLIDTHCRLTDPKIVEVKKTIEEAGVNAPANVKIIAKFVAIEQTGKNALCLYSLDT